MPLSILAGVDIFIVFDIHYSILIRSRLNYEIDR